MRHEDQLQMGICLGLILVSVVASVAADKVPLVNVTLGLWEVRTTMTKDSSMRIPAETLAMLTPDQRARLEERMNARYARLAKATTRKECVGLETLKKGISFVKAGGTCTRSVLISTPTELTTRIDCDIKGTKSERLLDMEVLDPKNVSGSIHLLATRDNPINSTSTFTARWIAPLCK